MINFLNPWFLLGLAAIGAPVWLHLRRKDREQVVPFTGLRFLEDQPVAKAPPLQLKNIVLFLLRVLALALLVAAFARPYFASGSLAATSSRVFVIDNTLSRQAEQGLEHDKAYVLGEIAQAGAHEQIGVVVLGSEPRVVVNFGDSAQDAREKVQAITPTTERGTILSALRQADFLLRQSIGESKEIVVLSDFQKNQWTEDANAPPFLAPAEVKMPFPAGRRFAAEFLRGGAARAAGVHRRGGADSIHRADRPHRHGEQGGGVAERERARDFAPADRARREDG